MQIPYITALPLATEASRLPAYRSRISARGWATVCVPADGGRMRIVVYESWLEYLVLWLLLLRGDLYDLWAQPEPIFYTSAEGKRRKYTFDFMFISVSGQKTAVAVRPASRVSDRYREILDTAFAQLPRAFADTAVLITNTDFDRAAAYRAKELLTIAKSTDEEADTAVRAIISQGPKGVSLGLIIELSRLGDRAFAAALRLWQRQHIQTTSAGQIGLNTIFKSGEVQ